jgi:hypothetical protein
MYTGISSKDTESRRPFEHTMMQSPPSSNSLPPLHQVAYPSLNLLNEPSAYFDDDWKAIPEFHSHNPHERRSSSVPRKLVGRASPPYRQPQRLSPSASSAISETGSMAEFSYLDSDFSMPKSFYPDLFLTDGMAVPFSNEPTEGLYDAQTYLFPGHLESSRRTNGMSSASSPHLVDLSLRSNSYLPPVSSLTSSRGSSFDIDPAERATGGAAPLPLLYNSHHQPNQPEYMSQYDNQARSQQTTPDYQRYSSAPIMQSPYQGTSPVNQYSQPQYYSHSGSYPQQPRPQTSYTTRHPGPADTLSQFPPAAHPVDLSMDHFEQNRPGKRRRGNLPKQVTDLLRTWLNEHLHHPYPTEDEKQMLMAQTGLTIHQVSTMWSKRREDLGLINVCRSATGSSMPVGVGFPISLPIHDHPEPGGLA